MAEVLIQSLLSSLISKLKGISWKIISVRTKKLTCYLALNISGVKFAEARMT